MNLLGLTSVQAMYFFYHSVAAITHPLASDQRIPFHQHNRAAADKPSKEQIQAMVDKLNALGWNAGIRTSSKSIDFDAWWHLTPSTAPATNVRQLIENYRFDV